MGTDHHHIVAVGRRHNDQSPLVVIPSRVRLTPYFLIMRRSLFLAGLLLLVPLVEVVFAIYPDDHWDQATKLTKGSMDDFVKENVDAGKT